MKATPPIPGTPITKATLDGIRWHFFPCPECRGHDNSCRMCRGYGCLRWPVDSSGQPIRSFTERDGGITEVTP